MSRAFWQLAIGTAIGAAIAAYVDMESNAEFTGGVGLRMIPAVAAFVLLVGLSAAAGPARRALQIQPTEALKAE